MLGFNDIQAARVRIDPYVRRTPMIKAWPVKQPLIKDGLLYLKLENLQITGAFKARGAVNKIFSLSSAEISRGMVTASGGNHGLGVAYGGWLAKAPVTVYLPLNTPRIKAEKLDSWGAQVIFEDEVWDTANQAALAAAKREGMCYIHPFADPAVIAGQGTLALEILEDEPAIDMILVAIGGGD